MNRTTVVKGGAEVDVCASPRPSGTELHVTARPEGPGRGDAEAVLEALAGAIVERRGAPLQEKLYGSLAARGDVLRIRDAVYRRRGIDPELPLTWIEGLPLAGEPLVGAQVWAVEPARQCITFIRSLWSVRQSGGGTNNNV